MEFLNSDDFIGEISCTIFIKKNIVFIYKNQIIDEKCKDFFAVIFKYFQSSVIVKISMVASEKSRKNISDYNLFLFKKSFEVNNKQFFSCEKRTHSSNCIYDYADSFFVEDF